MKGKKLISFLLLVVLLSNGLVGSFVVGETVHEVVQSEQSETLGDEESSSELVESKNTDELLIHTESEEEKPHCESCENSEDDKGCLGEVNVSDESPEQEIISISDAQLEFVLKEHLQISPEGTITEEKMKELVTLDAQSSGITLLSGLEYAVNLKSCNLKGNELEDISPLTDLFQLEELDLSYNKIIDVEALSNLTQLKKLVLLGNHILNKNFLNNLTELEILEIEDDQVLNTDPKENNRIKSEIDNFDKELEDKIDEQSSQTVPSIMKEEDVSSVLEDKKEKVSVKKQSLPTSSTPSEQPKTTTVKTLRTSPEKQATTNQGWTTKDNKIYFYENGVFKTGWFRVNNLRYYADSQGVVQIGLQKIGSSNYYFSSTGAMQTGWHKIGNSKYYFSADGTMRTGWMYLKGVWYYLQPSGAMKTGWVYLDDVWYYLDYTGAMKTGWVRPYNVWYYLAPNGAMQTGWKHISGEWYYLHSSGAMHTGWLQEGNTWYYLASSGAMQVGWQKVFGNWYYLDNSGAMKTGWLHTGGAWYYLESSGAMVTGEHYIDWVRYSFSNSGALLQYQRNAKLDDPYVSFIGNIPDPRTINPQIVENINAQTIVNKYNALPNNYYPQNLVQIVSNYDYEALCADAAEAWNRLERKASSMGVYLTVVSSIRSREDQQWLFNSYAQGSMTSAIKYAAYPRRSEHELGYAVDVGTSYGFTTDFGNTAQGRFMEQYAADYGFVLRYPWGKEHITGYAYESWHYRYLGVELAKELNERGLTLEEYYGLD